MINVINVITFGGYLPTFIMFILTVHSTSPSDGGPCDFSIVN